MIEVSEAIERILEATKAPSRVRVPIVDAAGRYSCESVLAKISNPRFDQSAFDGFALKGTRLLAGRSFVLTGTKKAGDPIGNRIREGEAVRVYTGAPIPIDTSAVAMQEIVAQKVATEGVTLKADIAPGEGIRRAGSDTCRGQRILDMGTPITPGVVGLLASQGYTDILVPPPPKVSIICTGNEIVAPGDHLGMGKIFNSNGAMIDAFCRLEGVSRIKHENCPDTLASTKEAIQLASMESDILIISGGMSVGDYDFVKPALRAAGFSIEFWGVNMKPGKPFAFATRDTDKTFAFCLPGNPVSVLVTLVMFVAPAIKRWLGAGFGWCPPRMVLCQLSGQLTNPSERPHFVRGKLDGGIFYATEFQESHGIRNAASANSLLRIEPGTTLIAGDIVSSILISGI